MFSVYRVYHASDVTALCFIFLLAIWGGCKLSSIWRACFQPNTIQETICFGCLCKTCKQKLTGRDVELLHDCRTRKLICKKSNICFFWNFRYLNFYLWILDVCRKVRVKKLNSMTFFKVGARGIRRPLIKICYVTQCWRCKLREENVLSVPSSHISQGDRSNIVVSSKPNHQS